MCRHKMLYFTYRITARLKCTLRYKTILSFMQNKLLGNSVFKRNSDRISVVIGYANEDLFVDSTSAYR